ncbi:HTH_Tnp_Tc3_2 domain-containing protein [Trichonephila clavipes]|nr:HTH_Tnp_Tc3_2 domain-containing protein [Trichonephila clavipes]
MACLVTSSSPVPLKSRRVEQRCTLNLSRNETSSRWCVVVVRSRGARVKPSVSIQSKDGVLRQGKAGRQHPKQRRSPKTGVWQRFQGDGNVSRCYSTGHPRVTTPNEDRYLAVTAKRNRRGTASDLYRQLSSATGTTVSRQTVYRRLGHIGL